MSALLQITGLAKRFGGVRAVDGMDLSLRAGERLALIGPNGAGKSTLFNMLMGQLKPDSGSVTLDGREITGLPPRNIWRLGVGRTFQITATYPSMTVIENVQMALLTHYGESLNPFTRARERHRDEAITLLERVGMAPEASRPAAELAYGNLKRLELATALANTPRLLLMDEPTAGMAPGERAALMALVSEIAAERGTAVLFTEHDMDTVFAHADRIAVLDRGRLIANGPPDAIRADATVRAVYLGGTADA